MCGDVWHSSTPSRPVNIISNVPSIVGCISIYLEIVMCGDVWHSSTHTRAVIIISNVP
jgi:hypothetical protein